MGKEKRGQSQNPINLDDEDEGEIRNENDCPSTYKDRFEDDATSKTKFIPTKNIYVDFVVHHRGTIVIHPETQYLEYVGGEISRIEGVEPDYVCYTRLCKSILRLGYASVPAIYYALPKISLNLGLLLYPIEFNRDIIDACEIAKEQGEVHLYLKHGVDETFEQPVILSLTYPNSSQVEDGNMERVDEGYQTDGSLVFTDDEEYLENINKAKKKLKGKEKVDEGINQDQRVDENVNEENTERPRDEGVNVSGETVDDQNVNEGNVSGDNHVHDADYYDFDIGTEFKNWDSNDEDDSCSDYDPNSSSDEEDWMDAPRPKKKVEVTFNPNIDIQEFNFCVDMIFESNDQLKDQSRSYAAAKGYPIYFKTNDKLRIQARCFGCKWELWASWKDSTLKIKTYQKNHMCSRSLKLRNANSKWLAKKVGDQIRLSPFMKLAAIKDTIKKDVGVDVTLKMCRNVKIRALDEVKQSMVEHYSKLWNYVKELQRTNPGSTIILKGSGEEWAGPPEFKRFYICFDAIRKGFLQGCRKFIGVDGCFLKTWIKGELLVAMGRDPNNQMYPIAWAVVEKEDQHTWGWFLALVDRDIGIGDGSGWTLMSDQQKGLELAVKNSFPEIEHRNCARHIYANFRKRGFTGVNYRKDFWSAAKSTTQYYFNKNMDKIRKLSEAAYQHLMERDPSRWCKAFFPSDRLVDSVDNNLCESFNAWILEARYKPLISMLEEIRKQVMVRLREKRKAMIKRKDLGRKFGQRVYNKLQDSIQKSRECNAIWNGDELFEIGGSMGGTTVDLISRSCTCRAWQLSGIPCCHGICAITNMRRNPEDYISDCYKVETYLNVYGTMMKTLNGKHMWTESDKQVLLHPPLRMVKGRPRWNRMRDQIEDGKGKGSAKEQEQKKETR